MNIKDPQLVSNTRSGQGMRCDEAPQYYRSVSSKGAGRPCLTHHHKGGWNETKWMRWVEKWWNEICGRGKRENPMKNLLRLRFVHHETHMEGPRSELGTPAVGGERLTACTTRPPKMNINKKLSTAKVQMKWQTSLKKNNQWILQHLQAHDVIVYTVIGYLPY